jgi:hypothetical protein
LVDWRGPSGRVMKATDWPRIGPASEKGRRIKGTVKKFVTLFLAAMLLATVPGVALAVTGNGAPSGPHYNLNIIGVDNPKTADMTGTNGHTIFVALSGHTKINLCESGVDDGCEDVVGYQVIDRNGTDSNGALFALPNPDPDGDGTTVYSVWARALGTPGGKSLTTTCATDESGELECSLMTLELTRDKGRSKFDDVSKYLLYIYADIDEDGSVERVPLFSDKLQGYFWDYDNYGLKLAQLRFYEIPSEDIPAP